MWSIGCITHALICGALPFDNNDRDELIRLTKEEPFRFLDPMWEEVSLPCRELIDRLMIKNPDERITLQETLDHDWFKNVRHKYRRNTSKVNVLSPSPTRRRERVKGRSKV